MITRVYGLGNTHPAKALIEKEYNDSHRVGQIKDKYECNFISTYSADTLILNLLSK